jgi:hypothetical protein
MAEELSITLPLLIQLLLPSKYSYFNYFYYERETKHLENRKPRNKSEPSELSSH